MSFRSFLGNARISLLILLVGSVLAGGLTPEVSRAQTNTANLVFDFEIFDGGTVLPLGPSGSWDSFAIYTPFVIEHDGLFHMFYTGFPGTAFTNSKIGYASSDDGIHWTKYEGNPVLSGPPGLPKIQSSSVMVEDGNWIMYINAGENFRPVAGLLVYRATAPAPTGPWTLDDAPSYQPTAPTWNTFTMPAGIFAADQGYQLFFNGWGRNAPEMGLATSFNGLVWEFHDDPGTTQTPYDRGDPILRKGEAGAWDRGGVASYQVIRTEHGYEMFYAGFLVNPFVGPNGATVKLGYATSIDGVHWEKYIANPVIDSEERTWPTIGALYADGKYFIYYDPVSGRQGLKLMIGTISEQHG